ncbi:MAG: cytochrome c3 family protein [bacterium]|nr:cytochrome c3 family protein [bacterium]
MQVKSLFVAFLLILSLNMFAQAPGKPLSAEGIKGESLFKLNCASCHAMNAKLVGPALQDVHLRRSEDWLLKWIKNNEKLRASGDKDAIAVYNENGKAAMNIFENLSDDQIKSIIGYIKEWTPPVKVGPVVGDPAEADSGFFSSSTLYILLFLIVILMVVLLILRRTKGQLQTTVNEVDGISVIEPTEPTAAQKRNAELKKRSNPTIVKLSIGTVVALSLALYGYKFGATEIGVQQGYAPEQPINFSHKIHAGEYKIDCKYCHSTVEKSKQASVPSVNTCMNCHKGVQAREKYNGEISPEIKKIYAAMDYDPDKPNGQQFGANPKPIKWIRVHNLPDHAYFNHSMHVKGVGLTCQTCHGPVQAMPVIQQYATLQMGWCINCHRERNIDVENNPYYEKLHAKIKAEKDNKSSNYSKYYTKDGKINVSAAQNGALECSKCHY